jgi:hypothetical protein
MLTAKSSDWRWRTDKTGSQWYPSLRIFKQQQHLDWNKPVLEIIEALEVKLNKLKK